MIVRLTQKIWDAFRREGFRYSLDLIYIFFDKLIHPHRYVHYVQIPIAQKFLLFVTGEPKNSTSFYRCEIPKEQLKKLGYQSDILYKDYVSRKYIDKYKHVVWYRLPYKREYSTMMGKRKLIFSIDDLMFDDLSVKSQPWIGDLHPQDREKLINESKGMKTFLQNADSCIVSTQYLKYRALDVSQKPVFVYRNSFSDDQLEQTRGLKVKSDPNILVFSSGSYTQNENLEMISGVIERIMSERSEIKLKLIGRVLVPKNLKKFSDRIITPGFQSVVGFLKEMKFAGLVLMPLIDSPHNESKSELRAIQAGLVGVPIIATDTMAYHSIISNGDNGFLVSNVEGWYHIINNALDSDLSKLGDRLNEDVLNRYNSEKLGKSLVRFLKIYDK